jgi:hypothetical protein
MLERAKAGTRSGKYTALEYAQFADDLVILVDAHPRHAWLLQAVTSRLREAVALLHVEGWRRHSKTVRPHSALGYRPPTAEARVFPPLAPLPLPALVLGALGNRILDHPQAPWPSYTRQASSAGDQGSQASAGCARQRRWSASATGLRLAALRSALQRDGLPHWEGARR